jgi:hypothetical protein
MTDEERERELEREKEKAQRKEERKKAIKNLDTIISSLQELEDLPHVDQNGRRESGPRSGNGGGYADSRERWHTNSARNAGSSHQESFSSASTERKGDAEDKERTNSRGNGDEGTKPPASKDKENSSSRDTNNSGKGKEKEQGSKKGGLVRLSIFHKRPPKDKEKPQKKDTKKKPQKKGDEGEHGDEEDENEYVTVCRVCASSAPPLDVLPSLAFLSHSFQVMKKNKKKEATFNKMYQVQTLGEQEGGHYGTTDAEPPP